MSAIDPGCAKTRAFNLLVESSSQFSQSENQTCRRRLSEEGNRENGSTPSWPAHVFTRPGPSSDLGPTGAETAQQGGELPLSIAEGWVAQRRKADV